MPFLLPPLAPCVRLIGCGLPHIFIGTCFVYAFIHTGNGNPAPIYVITTVDSNAIRPAPQLLRLSYQLQRIDGIHWIIVMRNSRRDVSKTRRLLQRQKMVKNLVILPHVEEKREPKPDSRFRLAVHFSLI